MTMFRKVIYFAASIKCWTFESCAPSLPPFYSHTGRPSIDPELILRMLIVGYCSGIRSERRLCEEVHLNLAYRWFCRLGLDDAVPNHSTFSKNRHGRFRASDAFRQLFESVLRRCMTEGLVGGEGFATDASFIRADANRARGVPGDQVPRWEEPSRAVREYLAGWRRTTRSLQTMTICRQEGMSLSRTRTRTGLLHQVDHRNMPTRPTT